MRRWIAAVLWMAFGALWQPAQAWNGEGHRLVATHAARLLSIDARAEIEALYGQPADQVLPLLSTWADAIVTARPQTRPWHYVNIPRRADGFDRLRDCPTGDCVVGALENQWAVWRDRSAAPGTRREALQFLVHFVADLHQPLHCGDGGDRGGNDIAVEVEGVRSNLHRVWDGEFFPWHGLADLPAATDSDAPHIDFAAWAQESHRIAVEQVYEHLPTPGPDRVVRVSSTLVDAWWAVAQARVAVAATRLAALINAR